MNSHEKRRLLARIRELDDIPLDLDLFGESSTGVLPSKLVITPEDPGPLSTVFALGNGLIGYVSYVTILNNRPESVWILRFELEPPWPDPRFDWLPGPATGTPSRMVYWFPGGEGLEFPREEVINHRQHESSKLHRGEILRGYLVGLGWAPIPRQFSDGELVRMKFTVVDSIERPSSAAVEFLVDRTMEAGWRKVRRKAGSRREKLFSDSSVEVGEGV